MVESYNNSGTYQWDLAIAGKPFAFAKVPANQQNYIRQTSNYQKQQIDTSNQPGDNVFTEFWAQSQTSWHWGMGLNYQDIDASSIWRTKTSCGVELFEKDQVSLINKMEEIVSSSSSNLKTIGYSISGTDGIIYLDGTSVKTLNVGGSSSTLSSFSGTILDIASNGSQYLVLTTSGIYAGDLPTGSATKIYDWDVDITKGLIRWAKARIWVVGDTSIYALPLRNDLDTNVLNSSHANYVSTNDNAFFTYTDLVQIPTGVYASGYSGIQSHIEYFTLDSTYTIGAPTVVAEMTDTEVILSMAVSYGTLLAIGTNKNVYISYIGDAGQITRRSATVETNRPVYALFAQGDYFYASGSVSETNAGVEHAGIYKIAINTLIDQNNLIFAHENYLYCEEVYDSDKPVKSITIAGLSGRVVFAVESEGFYMEGEDFVDDGYIETGIIRNQTTEYKVPQYLSVFGLATDDTDSGTIEAFFIDQQNTLNTTPLLTLNVAEENKALNFPASDWTPQIQYAYRLLLTASSDKKSTPILNSWQVKSNPSRIKGQNITLTLDLNNNVKRDGKIQSQNTFEKYNAIKEADRLNQVVLLQDFRTGEELLVIIDQHQFLSSNSSDGGIKERDRNSFQGQLTILCHTVPTVVLNNNVS